MYDARQIANWFIKKAQQQGRSLSIMSLLKLVYISHGWHLEMRNAPLFNNKIEAWQYGPVIPDVYYGFRRQGVVLNNANPTVPEVDISPADADLLEQIWNIYGSLPAFRLSDMTHVPGGPWDIATKSGGNYARILDELIRQHYVDLRQRATAAAS